MSPGGPSVNHPLSGRTRRVISEFSRFGRGEKIDGDVDPLRLVSSPD
jgi:hypothetical protein